MQKNDYLKPDITFLASYTETKRTKNERAKERKAGQTDGLTDAPSQTRMNEQTHARVNEQTKRKGNTETKRTMLIQHNFIPGFKSFHRF